MQNRAFLRRLMAASLASLGALAAGRLGFAQDGQRVHFDLEPERNEHMDSSVPVVFEGAVLEPDGTPAEGAVVVSSAGGRAVADRNGQYRLEVQVPVEAARVQITAVGATGMNLVASANVEAASGLTPVDPLLLAQGTTCPASWLPTFGGQPGTDGTITTLAVFDDGNGSALYAGGDFTHAGGLPANRIAKWDGSSWSALSSGTDAAVTALTVFDDGNGSALYAGGNFTTAGGVPASRIAKWDGSSWAALGSGTNLWVLALKVFDDGSGNALYAGGEFTIAGGVPVNRIAKWDGTGWSALGSGMNKRVWSLAVFDDGGGSALYAGGDFTSAGSVTANRIAKWDGSSWSALGSGLGGGSSGNAGVYALAVFDDGSGSALYAGGAFTTAGGAAANKIAKWDGTGWSPLGTGLRGSVSALTVFDDGSGSALYAGGILNNGFSGIEKWDGTSWSIVFGISGIVLDLTVHNDGSGPELYAGGTFVGAGGYRISRWDGSGWTALGSGMGGGVGALTVFDDGGGPALYAGGAFRFAGGFTVRVAKWDGAGWTILGSAMSGGVSALIVFDDGSGPTLYAGGNFNSVGSQFVNNIVKWDGSSWTALGSGVYGGVNETFVSDLAVYDDGSGSALFAGGDFSSASGVPANGVAKWDGSNWSALGSGVSGGFFRTVYSLAVFDDGSGSALYAGGDFTSAGGIAAKGIARWDGANWSALGAGLSGGFSGAFALAVFDDGNGSALYAGGDFRKAGGFPARHVAKWDGASWRPLGIVNDYVYAFTVFDDGGGPALFAGGCFTSAGGVAASRIAKWDGASWSALGSGVSPCVSTLATLDDGSGSALYAGGGFASAPDSGDSFIAKWGCPQPPPATYCTGKTTSALCVPFLSCTGSPSATVGTFDIQSNDHVEGQVGLYLYSFDKASLSFHGGTLCVKAPFRPLSTLVKTIDGLACTSCSGNCRMFKRNFNALIQSGTDPLLTPGRSVNVQVRQRDPTDPTGFGDNLSNGIAFVIGP